MNKINNYLFNFKTKKIILNTTPTSFKRSIFQFKISKKKLVTRKKFSSDISDSSSSTYSKMIDLYISERIQNGLKKSSTIKFGFLPQKIFKILFEEEENVKRKMENYLHHGEKKSVEISEVSYSNLNKKNLKPIPSWITTEVCYENDLHEKFKNHLNDVKFFYNNFTEYLVIEIYYEVTSYHEKYKEYLPCC